MASATGWGIKRVINAIIKSAALKLTLYYLATIMGLSLGFSVFLYHVSSGELDRGLRRPGFVISNGVSSASISGSDFEQFRQDRLEEARDNLIFNLMVFNLFILLAGGLISYALAQKTLRPIEEAMESQSRFTADASHELRTPLTAMQTEIEVALRKRNLTTAQAKAQLESNLEEVIKLRGLSEGLLKLANGGEQALNKEVISLEDVSIDAMTNLVKAAQAKQISIENNVKPAQVFGDKVALTEALSVLIDNAIKYSPTGSQVTLAGGEVDGNARLSVTDQGQGISKKDLPHIFDRFYRSDQSRNKDKTEGYGLGLSIAQRIIRLHDGTITADSKTGKGSVFTITLPVSEQK